MTFEQWYDQNRRSFFSKDRKEELRDAWDTIEFYVPDPRLVGLAFTKVVAAVDDQWK